MAEEPPRTWGFALKVSFVAIYIFSSHIMIAFFFIIGTVILSSALESFREFAASMVGDAIGYWLWFAAVVVMFGAYGMGFYRASAYIQFMLFPPSKLPVGVPRRMKDMVPGWPDDGAPAMPAKTRPSPEEVERFGQAPTGGNTGSKR